MSPNLYRTGKSSDNVLSPIFRETLREAPAEPLAERLQKTIPVIFSTGTRLS
jgi:hypothetical protein